MANQAGTTKTDTNQFVFSVPYTKASSSFAEDVGPNHPWEPGTDLFRLVLGEFYQSPA